jgi:hypothetical protein
MKSRVNVLVLVVLSMVAGGLLAVGIPRLRQAFLRTTSSRCRFMLIALSLHNYNDVFKHLPLAAMPKPDLPPEKRLSWQVALLPFIEQDALWKAVAQDKAWDDEANRTVVHTVIDEYLCRAHLNQPMAGFPTPTHYVGLAGVGSGSALLPAGDPRAGLFGYERKISIPEVSKADGLSNTIAVIDTMCLIGPWAAGGPATVRELLPGVQP